MTFARFTARSRTAMFLVAGAALLAHGSASAGGTCPLRVPADYPTIQEAVDHALDGDTVRVSAGSYNESVVVDGRSSLSLIGDRGATIDGGPDAPAIHVTGGTAIVVRDFVLVSGVDVLRLESTTAPVVSGVRVDFAGGDGIHIEAVDGSVTVTGNRVDRTTGAGIHVELASNVAGQLTVSDNYVRTTGGDGIFAYSDRDLARIVIQHNDVADTGGYGIRTECGIVTITQNTVVSTGLDGVSMYRCRTEGDVIGNTITGAGGDGVSVEGTPSSVVQGNTITQSAGDGIDVAGPAVFITGNTVVDSGAAGVRTTETAAFDWVAGVYTNETVADNRVERTGDAGIVVTDGIGLTVATNEVTDVGGTAIDVSGDQLTVTGNTIDRPAIDGIDVANLGDRHGVVVIGNSIADAGADGVDIGSSDGVLVSRNEVDGAGDCGFRIGDGAQGNVLRRNVATGCTSFGLMESDEAGRNRINKNNRFGHSRRRARNGR